MKRFILSVFVASAATFTVSATTPNPIVIPDIEGYKTLKGDFHIHTVFSDATVWPTTRVQEALWEGLDIIAITDHVDSRLQKQVETGLFDAEKCDRDRSFEIAHKAAGKRLLVIHGGEISRGMPPGHWNCLFVTDCDKICSETEKYDDDDCMAMESGLKEAHAQGGFTMWNHPNWEKQAPNETVWWSEHTKLLDQGYMQGIEVYNKFAGYCPEAHRWALEHNITMFGDSDAHTPFFHMIDYLNGQHRPITLVFATERSEAAVRDALEHQRTAVYAEEMVYGSERMLRPLFDACVKVEGVKFSSKALSFTLVNKSCIPIRLLKAPGSEKFCYVRNYELRPFESITVQVRATVKDDKYPELEDRHIDVNFCVDTFRIGPDKPLPVTWHFDAPVQ